MKQTLTAAIKTIEQAAEQIATLAPTASQVRFEIEATHKEFTEYPWRKEDIQPAPNEMVRMACLAFRAGNLTATVCITAPAYALKEEREPIDFFEHLTTFFKPPVYLPILLPILLLLASCTKDHYLPCAFASKAGLDCPCTCNPGDTTGTDTTHTPPVDTVKVWPVHEIKLLTQYNTVAKWQYADQLLGLKIDPVYGDTGAIARIDGGATMVIWNSRGRQWTNFYADFNGYTVLNRGYGGAKWQDHAIAARDLANTDVKPKRFILKGGENELTLKENPTWFHATTIYSATKPWLNFMGFNFKRTIDSLRAADPYAEITYATMDLSPKFVAAGQSQDVKDINVICKQILAQYANTSIIEMENAFTAADYQSDKLHWVRSGELKALAIFKAALN